MQVYIVENRNGKSEFYWNCYVARDRRVVLCSLLTKRRRNVSWTPDSWDGERNSPVCQQISLMPPSLFELSPPKPKRTLLAGSSVPYAHLLIGKMDGKSEGGGVSQRRLPHSRERAGPAFPLICFDIQRRLLAGAAAAGQVEHGERDVGTRTTN